MNNKVLMALIIVVISIFITAHFLGVESNIKNSLSKLSSNLQSEMIDIASLNTETKIIVDDVSVPIGGSAVCFVNVSNPVGVGSVLVNVSW
ncbi:MAG: hypothetical protein QCI00_09080, partial [Candidatus Thermoplasmatota archaeon]|nr:hypothetical protein [Candidatus Thermoplasmatota archaeon]